MLKNKKKTSKEETMRHNIKCNLESNTSNMKEEMSKSNIEKISKIRNNI